jgi:adenine-specific DNA glycosylase
MAALPPERWIRASDALILHGRRICRPKPLCDQCVVRDDCDYFRLVVSRARDGKAPKKRKKRAAPARGSKRVRTARR